MSEFFKTSTIWVLDFRYDGRARRWFKAFGAGDDVRQQVTDQLHDLYGDRAVLVDVRRATLDEEIQYIRGDLPINVLCPTGR